MAEQKVMQNLQLVDIFYPVGSYYETSDTSFDPNTTWGGTWSLEAEGLVHIGAGSNYTVGDTGGEETHTLTINEMPSHTHTTHIALGWQTGGGNSVGRVTTNNGNYDGWSSWADSTGGDQPHNNMQPYVVVNRWHRTA